MIPDVALFSCPDCGLPVSDQAVACPKCGRSVRPKAAVQIVSHLGTSALPHDAKLAQWLDDVRRLLAVVRPEIEFDDIDLWTLRSAFNNGVRPHDFVGKANIRVCHVMISGAGNIDPLGKRVGRLFRNRGEYAFELLGKVIEV